VSCSLAGSHLLQYFVPSGAVCIPYFQPGAATRGNAAMLEVVADGRPIGDLPMSFGKFSDPSSIHREYSVRRSACSRRRRSRRAL
jgi:hypothetical protein